ncbi:helix-turn-helix domain-containing protein [Aquicella lusitana]|uniref:Cytoskeletal protein RodZ n=1 Tax=Aquicella lusitana TaxID=254246 RepID=A0A370GNF0_9COXI|nr:helix-turn-helix domain-containing protein [Aquicella lusitana]RDI44806.1 cytoskeletal protein RodZ [Aquicella lusitana]VVC73003.1 Cytoskeleton protein RodZ [Aquicella lusitana]
MTNETQETQTTEHKPIPFGNRLKSAREALGLERKDAAAQLRLSEKIITMLEKDKYPAEIPPTFIRGYIRAYGKLLQIPEYEITKAIEPMIPKVTVPESVPTIKPALSELSEPLTSSNYFVQLFTYLVIFTILGLAGIWWYTKSSKPAATPPAIENPVRIIVNKPTNAPTVTESLPATASSVSPVANQATDNNALPSPSSQAVVAAPPSTSANPAESVSHPPLAGNSAAQTNAGQEQSAAPHETGSATNDQQPAQVAASTKKQPEKAEMNTVEDNTEEGAELGAEPSSGLESNNTETTSEDAE